MANGDVEAGQQWYDRKSALMEESLGEEHDMVMHGIIPYAIGGFLDLDYYPNGMPGARRQGGQSAVCGYPIGRRIASKPSFSAGRREAIALAPFRLTQTRLTTQSARPGRGLCYDSPRWRHVSARRPVVEPLRSRPARGIKPG